MDKVECARAIKEVLQLMQLWPDDLQPGELQRPSTVDVTGKKRRSIIFGESSLNDDGLMVCVGGERKKQFFQALIEKNVYLPDLREHNLCAIEDGNDIKEIRAVFVPAHIERIIQFEHKDRLPPEERGSAPGR